MPDTPVTWLEEFLVSPGTTATSFGDPTITQLTNGAIVVCWTLGTPDGTEIMAQIYDPTGTPIGAPFQVNQSSTADIETRPTVIALADGGFLVVYEDVGLAGTDIRLEEFDARGNPVSDSPLVAIDPEPSLPPNLRNATGASSSATSVLVLFDEDMGSSSRIRGMIYNPQTDSYGSLLTVLSGGVTRDASVTVLQNGNYVIAATRGPFGNSDTEIIFRILAPNGSSVLGTTSVAQTFDNGLGDIDSCLTALADGGFVITWRTLGGIGFAVHTSAGTQTAAGSFAVNDAVVAGLSDGSFVIVSDDDILGPLELQRYAADGRLMGRLTFAESGGDNVAVTDLGDGRFAVIWDSDSSAGGVKMQIFDTRDLVGAPTYAPEQWQVGTVGADVFTADLAAETVNAWDGNDIVTEHGGGAAYYLGAGNDTLIATSIIAADLHDGGLGIDVIDWSGATVANVTFDMKRERVTDQTGATEVMRGFETLRATNFADTVIGDDANNTLLGLDGTDTISGGTGNDSIRGGNQDDSLNGGEGRDSLVGEAGNDVVQGMNGFDLIDGGSGDDLLEGNAGDDSLAGGNGNDTLFGGASGDTLQGGNGNDRIEGSDGIDDMSGGSGNDTLTGNAGADALTGGDGDDALAGGIDGDSLSDDAGNDWLRGDDGGDTLSGGADHDVLEGNAGADDLRGGDGNDRLTGGINGDSLSGDDGNDRLRGDDGGDTLNGGAGNDVVEGNAGADIVYGAAGDDGLTGGIGEDIFAFDAGRDKVLDFQSDLDFLIFDDALWGNAALSISQILDFATVTGGNAVFDFGGGNVLTLVGVTNLNRLTDDIFFL